jgi:hypothetical protein
MKEMACSYSLRRGEATADEEVKLSYEIGGAVA